MTDRLLAADPAPDDRVSSVFRFTSELVAWVATPWVLASHSPVLAVASVILLIGLPTVFGTVGDRGHAKAPMVAVPGLATVGLVLLQFAAAVISAWVLEPWFGVAVILLVAVGAVTELPRWRWLSRH